MITPENLNQLLGSTTKLDPEQVKALNDTVKAFPYFQAARAIQLKGLYQNNSFAYNAALKKTAVYTTDRGILFDYITSEEFGQHRTATQIQTRLNAVESSHPTADFDESIQMDRADADRVLDPDLFEKPMSAPSLEDFKSDDDQAKPVQFDSSQSRSFSEWLKLTTAKPIVREEKQVSVSQKTTHRQKIIDQFIAKNPKITPPQDYETISPVNSESEGTRLMTETLAKIYTDQKNYGKAIQAYKILILKNPEKSGLFADRIREIEKHIENKSK